ncbi:MAG: tRNA guanosine(34) transglycosylase Tgt [SAR324 cluster bacterium]|nr:tRNA guanosine(34) transglycosylase Tgt [SAR324 cluster bacterium]
MLHFQITANDGAARTGELRVKAGVVHTPAFMPVGTLGTVKAMTPEELREVGAEIVLANTYHLHLRPGEQVVANLGGLHSFMHWEGPILTDSGGYQVFSLSALNTVEEQGVHFRSHLDGSALFLSPESAVGIQEALGSDIMMCLDHVLALPAQEADLEDAVARTGRWAKRCLEARRGAQALFGIVQGGTSQTLRRRSAEEICALGFDGHALGGLSVGEAPQQMYDTVAFTVPLLPPQRPRYLMGSGEPGDLLAAIACGVDMFDCVLPTRNARNGSLYTRHGKISIKQARYREDPAPLEESCPCPTCRNYSRAYLRHLYVSSEILSMRLNTYHNLYFFLDLMRQARGAIAAGRFAAFAAEFLAAFNSGEVVG